MNARIFISVLVIGITTSHLSLPKAHQNKEPQLVKSIFNSPNFDEFNPSFDVVNQELFFMRRNPGSLFYTFFSTTKTETGWSEPTIAPFSGQFRDDAPFVTSDGNTLFFDSNRPHPKVAKGSINIWKTNRTGNSWDEPEIILSASTNDNDEPTAGLDEFGPEIDEEGNLYFYSFRRPFREGKRFMASYASNYKDVNPENSVPDPSARTFVSYIGFSLDGRTAVLEGRHPNRRDPALFYSCKNEDGGWSEAQLIPFVNSRSSEGGPFITADGAWLYFSSNRPATGTFDAGSDIYMISTEQLPIPCR